MNEIREQMFVSNDPLLIYQATEKAKDSALEVEAEIKNVFGEFKAIRFICFLNLMYFIT